MLFSKYCFVVELALEIQDLKGKRRKGKTQRLFYSASSTLIKISPKKYSETVDGSSDSGACF